MNWTLTILPEKYSICRLPRAAVIPEHLCAADLDSFVSISRTMHELSIVCQSAFAPQSYESRSDGWRCLRLDGVFDLTLTGVLSSILSPLAAAKISLFAISTFDTDYLLLRDIDLPRAIDVLAQAGHQCRT